MKANAANMTGQKVQSIDTKTQNRINPHLKRIEKLEADIRRLNENINEHRGEINRLYRYKITQNISIKKFTESNSYKGTLAATKVLSNVLALWGIGNFIRSGEKLKTKNLVTLLSDLTTVTSTMLGHSSKLATSRKPLSAMSRNLFKYNVNVGKFAAGLNMFIVIYTTVSKYTDLDDVDTDAEAITLVSGGLQFGLFVWLTFYSGPLVLWGVALAVFALGEWLIYKFENTKVENYILKSIFAKEDSLIFTSGDNYAAKILRQTLSNENKAIGEFKTSKDVQNYLGYKNKELKPIFISALKQEISELTKALHGYELILYGDPVEGKEKEIFIRKTGIQIPKALFEDKSFKMIIVDENGGYEEIKTEEGLETHETFYVYDLLIPSFSDTYINRINNKKYSIIVITNNISMKYNYRYYDNLTVTGVMGKLSQFDKEINNFKETLLNQKDE
ncbi:MAG: hypothetical protein HRT68_17230, partial [Flavobacteriaceae bacterium]|nr:hypothetical protein [Flavobacteriaceae bacterium]